MGMKPVHMHHLVKVFLNLMRLSPSLWKKTGYDGDWFSIDLCFWAGAWEVTENAKTFLAPYLEKY